MKCPLCSTEVKDGAKECPSCGAIFAKLLARKEREKKEAAEGLARIEAGAQARAFNPWIGRTLAISIVVMWMITLAFYYRIHFIRPKADRPPVAVSEISNVLIPDAETGRLKRVQVHKAPSAQQRPSEQRRLQAPASGQGPPPEGAPKYDPDFDD